MTVEWPANWSPESRRSSTCVRVSPSHVTWASMNATPPISQRRRKRKRKCHPRLQTPARYKPCSYMIVSSSTVDSKRTDSVPRIHEVIVRKMMAISKFPLHQSKLRQNCTPNFPQTSIPNPRPICFAKLPLGLPSLVLLFRFGDSNLGPVHFPMQKPVIANDSAVPFQFHFQFRFHIQFYFWLTCRWRVYSYNLDLCLSSILTLTLCPSLSSTIATWFTLSSFFAGNLPVMTFWPSPLCIICLSWLTLHYCQSLRYNYGSFCVFLLEPIGRYIILTEFFWLSIQPAHARHVVRPLYSIHCTK